MFSVPDMCHDEFAEWLRKHEACAEAVDWVIEHGHTPASAFEACSNGSWIIWAANRFGAPTDLVVECGIRCALEIYDESAFVRWAERWIDGSDRSVRAARAAADMALALTYSAYAIEANAARAAAAAAARAAAARAAWAARFWSARAACEEINTGAIVRGVLEVDHEAEGQQRRMRR